jgi:D-lactate dehydrogenase (cytochrome)
MLVMETSTVSLAFFFLPSPVSPLLQDSCLPYLAIILYNRKTEYEKTKHLVHDMVKRAIELEGTATGEHGVGLVKRDYLPHELGTDTVDAMRQLKKAFDPLCLLNCDKIVRTKLPKKGEVAEW